MRCKALAALGLLFSFSLTGCLESFSLENKSQNIRKISPSEDEASTGTNMPADDGSTDNPGLVSIVRASSAENPTRSSPILYTVTFSKPVTGVGVADFVLTSNGTVSGTISSVTAVSDSVYTVTVGSVSGNGTLRLDLSDADASIKDAGGRLLETATSEGEETFTIDRVANRPDAPILKTPLASPGNNPTPVFTVPGVEVGATVALYRSPTCAAGYQIGSSVASSTSVDVTVTTPLTHGSHSIFAKQIDSLGNLSNCSLLGDTYQLDTEAPSIPTALALQNPATSPGSNLTPTIQVSGVVVGDTASLYADPTCSLPTLKASGPVLSGTTVDLTSLSLTDGVTYQFYAKSTDPVGNSSDCSTATVSYAVQTAAPTPNSPTLKVPAASPSNDTTPELTVSGVEGGATVTLYKNSTCSAGQEAGSGVASGSSIDITVSPPTCLA